MNEERSDPVDDRVRRRLLAASVAGAGTAFLAGCTAGSDGDDSDDDGDEGGTTSGGNDDGTGDPDDERNETDDANDESDDDGEDDESDDETGSKAERREVSPGESIQEAIDETVEGGTVEVRPGTYAQSVTVDKELALTAPDEATLDGADSEGDVAVTVAASGVEISGFEIVRYRNGVSTESQVDQLSVVDVSAFDNFGSAISVAGRSVAVTDVLAEDNGASPIVIDATDDGDVTVRNASITECDGAAVSITGGASVEIDRLDALRNGGDGIVLEGGDVRGRTASITDSSVVDHRDGSGIVVSETRGDDEITITNTETIDNAGAGIDVAGDVVTVTGAEAVGNGPTEAGVWIKSSSDGVVTVRETTVEETARETGWFSVPNPGYGISIVDGETITVEDVSLAQNGGHNLLIEADDVRGQSVEISGGSIERNGSGNGITIPGSGDDDEISIADTDVYDHDGDGIYLGSSGDSEVTVENVTVADSADNGLVLSGATVEVLDVTATNNGEAEAGILVTSTANGAVTVRDTTVEGTTRRASGNSGHGISIVDGETITIENVSFVQNARQGLRSVADDVRGQTVEIIGSSFEGSDSGTGIWISGSTGDDEVRIADTDVFDQGGDGIYVGSSGDDAVTVENVTVADSADNGLDVSGATVEVFDVTATNNGEAEAGILVTSTSNGTVTVRDTTVEGTTRRASGNSGHGISIVDGETITVENVSLARNAREGLRIAADDVRGQTVEISASSFEGSDRGSGIWYSGSSGHDEVTIANVESNGNSRYGISIGGEAIVIEDTSADGNEDGPLELTDVDESEATIRNSF